MLLHWMQLLLMSCGCRPSILSVRVMFTFPLLKGNAGKCRPSSGKVIYLRSGLGSGPNPLALKEGVQLFRCPYGQIELSGFFELTGCSVGVFSHNMGCFGADPRAELPSFSFDEGLSFLVAETGEAEF